jgi:hypothetical protein
MSEQSQLRGPVEALAAFDQARDAFLTAFAQAPDEALSFVPPGDEYALGVLPIHLQDPMHDYMTLFAAMLRGGFAPLDRSSDASGADAAARHHADLAAQRPTGAERANMLRDLARAHQYVHTTVESLDEATFNRQAPITYSAGALPFPTSARDIMGWLTDHYREHTEQIGAMLELWRHH